LAAAGSCEVHRERLAIRLLVALEERLSGVGILDDYRSRCLTLGQDVRVERHESTVEGRAIGIDERGALVVEGAAGPVTIAFGDVVHLRPLDGDR
jgi:BirA family biotin operon repressor/biotin-[acetyl-CoA-carboxylase] ligase